MHGVARIAALLCFCLVMGAATALADDVRDPASLGDQLDRILDGTVAEFAVPGAAVGVWRPGFSWVRTRGFADIDAQRPIKGRDHFAIRSVTKSFTVTLIL